MFTYNGIKKVHCTLEGNKVVIDGVGYEITSLKETTPDKSKTFSVLAMLTGVALVLGGEGTRELIGGDKSGSLFLLVPFILMIPVIVYLACIAMSQSGCRSLWRIN